MFSKLGYQGFESAKNNVEALTNSIENISNINSVGYKKTQTTFTETLNGERIKQESKNFSQGHLRRTGEVFDIALDGPGFFEVELSSGQRAYTRAGRLKLTNEGELVTDEGYKVVPQIEQSSQPLMQMIKGNNNALGVNLEVSTPKLIIPANLTPEISDDGTISGINPQTGEKAKIGKINVAVFNNPQGLESLGKGYYLETAASGQTLEADANSTKVKQGFLEFGNVDMVAELMNISQLKGLITAQFKALKAIDKIYEQIHYTISKSV